MVLDGRQRRGDIVVVIVGESRGNSTHSFGIIRLRHDTQRVVGCVLPTSESGGGEEHKGGQPFRCAMGRGRFPRVHRDRGVLNSDANPTNCSLNRVIMPRSPCLWTDQHRIHSSIHEKLNDRHDRF